MLINFNDLYFHYGKPKGVIHIGAHLREEKPFYTHAGISNIIWVEANKNIYNYSIESGGLTDGELFFNEVISDIDDLEVSFKITNNGQSSSILDLDKHKIHHPDIFVVDCVNLKTKRFDTLVKEHNIDITKYNFVNLDIQGAELLALKGFGDLLSNIDYVYTEINSASLYKGCALINEIDEYLSDFVRSNTVFTDKEWGDAFYSRKTKNETDN